MPFSFVGFSISHWLVCVEHLHGPLPFDLCVAKAAVLRLSVVERHHSLVSEKVRAEVVQWHHNISSYIQLVSDSGMAVV